jgi:hypothetical protein
MMGFKSLPIFALLILGPLWASATELTCGKLFYRTLFLDEESSTLYVGAMDRIIKIDNLNNITNTNCDKDSMVRFKFLNLLLKIGLGPAVQ